jgi:hypothetical protein
VYDDPNNSMQGMPEDEWKLVNDHSTISFNGIIRQGPDCGTLLGNVDVRNQGMWVGSPDHLAPGAPRHQFAVPMQDIPFGLTLDQEVQAGISNPIL